MVFYHSCRKATDTEVKAKTWIGSQKEAQLGSGRSALLPVSWAVRGRVLLNALTSGLETVLKGKQ